jgi:hypothetical protein
VVDTVVTEARVLRVHVLADRDILLLTVALLALLFLV